MLSGHTITNPCKNLKVIYKINKTSENFKCVRTSWLVAAIKASG